MGTPPVDFCSGRSDFPSRGRSAAQNEKRAHELDCDFDKVFDKINALFQGLEKKPEGLSGELKPIGEIQVSVADFPDKTKLCETINHLIAAYTLAVAFGEKKCGFKVKAWTKDGVKIVDQHDVSAVLRFKEEHISDGQLLLSQVFRDLVPLMREAQQAKMNRRGHGEVYQYETDGYSEPETLPGYFNKHMEWITNSKSPLQADCDLMRRMLLSH